MGDNRATAGASAPVVPAMTTQSWTIGWLDHAERWIGRTTIKTHVLTLNTDMPIDIKRRHRRLAVIEACNILADGGAIARQQGYADAGFVITDDDLHLVQGFVVQEAHE